ncbi:MAG TPA: arginine--tRNA ligase [Candidatus Paceibacterota bacterium]|nr:arginine--tRNA ligase [Candidatus Paceibacterota bacterium]
MEERIKKVLGEVVVTRPPNVAMGDYALFGGAKAAEYAGALTKEFDDEAAVGITNGFVNITLSHDAVTKIIADAAKEDWGKNTAQAGKRVLIEYSNPNAFKEMHAGHLVGTVVGEALSRFIENDGATVIRDTFGGDIGPNVAKALWGLRKNNNLQPMSPKEIGAAYTLGSNAYETDETAKKEIDELNQAIYAGTDEAVMDLWHRGREISMEEFRRIWTLLGTHFDYEFFDSDTTETGVREVRNGLEKGIFKMSDGAIIYDGEPKGVHTMVFITSHDTPTYEAKDIGLAFLKEERVQSDEIIILTGNEQTGRFKTVLAALEDIAPLVAKKMRHLATGFLKLTTGKMSSREGNVITAAELLTEVMQKASEKNDDPLIAEQVAVGAVKYMILRQSPGQDIIFDPEKSLSLEGDSGPYLQYALVRARKILAYEGNGEGGSASPSAPYDLERLIIHYPHVAARAAAELAPQLLVNYLTELAAAWNSFYAQEQILGSAEEMYKQKLAHAFANTMERGLSLLGIPAPEKM